MNPVIRCAVLIVLVGCATHGSKPDPTDPDPTDPEQREHDQRFHGWWIVEQPTHAVYESTHYNFLPDGALELGPSFPADCTGHLSEHCVTGSVANCVGAGCQSALTCVFGTGWYSLDSSHLAVAGKCSDGKARDIVIEMNMDASSNTGFGGAGGKLLSVDGDASWTHDNWDWVFRKCPAGTDPTSCH